MRESLIPGKIGRWCLGAVLAAAVLFGGVGKAAAYDNDTHFWLTYYLAVKAGYTRIQAAQIASANISVDFDLDTNPVLARPGIKELFNPYGHAQNIRADLHALPRKSAISKAINEAEILWWDPQMEEDDSIQKIADEMVQKRKKEFWIKTIEERENPGLFLHFLQDSFPHRKFKSYIGHAGYERIDFLSSDKDLAWLMVEDTLRHLIAYRELAANRMPFQDAANPGRIDPAKILGDNALKEIAEMFEKFIAVNHSDGVEPTNLISIWKDLKPHQRKRSVFPSDDFLKELKEISDKGVSPDSRKARDLVVTSLGYTPYVWVYDLNRQGSVAQKFTRNARSYHSKESNGDHTSKKERGYFERASTPDVRGKCLPYRLIKDDVTDFEQCR